MIPTSLFEARMLQDPVRSLRVKLCNCARCGRELLGICMEAWLEEQPRSFRSTCPPIVAGRIDNRPYCRECYSAELARLAYKSVRQVREPRQYR